MKKRISFFCCILMLIISIQSTAQSPEDTKKWMDYMTPSDIHKMIAKWDGEWIEDIQMWMAPGTPPQSMQATCVNKMVLGGRYQESKHTGDFMGMPFEGIGTTGWDNLRKVFVSSWADNMSTGMIYLEGGWNEGSKSMELKGKSTDPMSGKLIDIRQIMKIVDENTQVLEQYTTQGGKEFKSMEIKLTRKK